MELHDHGLVSDLEMMRRAAERRQVLRWLLAGASSVPSFTRFYAALTLLYTPGADNQG